MMRKSNKKRGLQRMSMSKSLIVSLFASLMLILAACSGGDTDSSADPSDSGGTDDGELSGEITVAGWNLAADALSASAEAFMELHPNTTINVEYVTSDYNAITPPLTAGRGAPDVIQIQQRDFPNFLHVFPNQFVDLSDRLNERKDEFSEFAWDQVLHEGVPYAVPWDIGPVGFYYRIDYFEQAGIDPNSINTWDDYIAAGEKIKEELDVYMMAHDLTSNDVLEIYRLLFNQLGGQFYDENGNINFVTEENIRAIEMQKRIVDAGIVLNAPTWDDRIRAFANGQTASVVFPVWYAGTIKTQAEDQKGLWGIREMPAFEEGGPNQANTGGSILAISTQSENEELAYQFIEFTLMTNEGQDIQMNYGLFPSWTPYYETENFSQVDEYFDMPLYEFFGSVSTDIPPIDWGAFYMDVNDALVEAVGSVLADEKDIEQALRDAERRASRDTGLDISGQ